MYIKYITILLLSIYNNNLTKNKNIILTAYEAGTCSLYEFIFSYRKKSDAPFPDITSKEAVEAIKMIKRMKEELDAGNIHIWNK